MEDNRFITVIRFLIGCTCFILISAVLLFIVAINPGIVDSFQSMAKVEASVQPPSITSSVRKDFWEPPDSLSIPYDENGKLIRYGQELVAHTSLYLGPKGKVMQISNGMNCQNCHLRSGKKIFGNNYSAVASTYPKFRARSGSIETIEKRVNDCIERSLNGKSLPENSRELKAFVAYITWVGKDVEKGKSPKGSGLWELPFMDRPASASKGKLVFEKHCAICHGANAEGKKSPDGNEWKYPPLSGQHSYNTGAGLLRLSRFAGYVKANMPNGATFENPILTDEEAWDVAAFINSLPRPAKTFPNDWPDIAGKPFDHPFGPFADSFSEEQHKYGPFAAISKARGLTKKK